MKFYGLVAMGRIEQDQGEATEVAHPVWMGYLVTEAEAAAHKVTRRRSDGVMAVAELHEHEEPRQLDCWGISPTHDSDVLVVHVLELCHQQVKSTRKIGLEALVCVLTADFARDEVLANETGLQQEGVHVVVSSYAVRLVCGDGRWRICKWRTLKMQFFRSGCSPPASAPASSSPPAPASACCSLSQEWG